MRVRSGAAWATECQYPECYQDQVARGYCSLHSYRLRSLGAALGAWRRQKVRVISCPENFYPRGALLEARDFFGTTSQKTNSLKKGYWIPGMVIETAEGQRWRVEGEQMEPQALVRQDDELVEVTDG